MPSPQKATAEKSALRVVAVADLLFDEQNPRLPETVLAGKTGRQGRIAEYFEREGTLDELAMSLVDNGYFGTEPLIVTKEGAPAGKWIVLEGNRRLAALKLIVDGTPAVFARLDVQPSPGRRRALREVPALEVARREDATAMIGFRHIGGMKLWDSEAKARWIRREVEARGDSDPFAAVGRMVGMARSAVRYYYLSAAVTRIGAEEGLDISRFVVGDRFGVLLRAIQNGDIRTYMGLSDETDLEPIKKNLASVRKSPKGSVQVLQDLSEPVGVSGRPLVSDSRHIADYARILTHARAEKKLRTEGWDAAVAELAETKLDEYVARVLVQVRRLRDRLVEEPELPEPVVEKVKELQRIAKSLLVRED